MFVDFFPDVHAVYSPWSHQAGIPVQDAYTAFESLQPTSRDTQDVCETRRPASSAVPLQRISVLL